MAIKLNGAALELADGTSILELLEARKLAPDKVIVEHNGTIVGRESWRETRLKDGDTVFVLSFVGGG